MRYALRVYLLKRLKTTTPDAPTHGERLDEYDNQKHLGINRH